MNSIKYNVEFVFLYNYVNPLYTIKYLYMNTQYTLKIRSNIKCKIYIDDDSLVSTKNLHIDL